MSQPGNVSYKEAIDILSEGFLFRPRPYYYCRRTGVAGKEHEAAIRIHNDPARDGPHSGNSYKGHGDCRKCAMNACARKYFWDLMWCWEIPLIYRGIELPFIPCLADCDEENNNWADELPIPGMYWGRGPSTEFEEPKWHPMWLTRRTKYNDWYDDELFTEQARIGRAV